jgi:hypothetical protein
MQKQNNKQKIQSKDRLQTNQDNQKEMLPLSQERGVFDLEDQDLEQITGNGPCCSVLRSAPKSSVKKPEPRETNRQDNPFRYEPDPGRRLRLAGKYLQEEPQIKAPDLGNFVRESTNPDTGIALLHRLPKP